MPQQLNKQIGFNSFENVKNVRDESRMNHGEPKLTVISFKLVGNDVESLMSFDLT